jgi:hypothetical protein
MKLIKEEAKAIIDAENDAAGLPIRGVHVLPSRRSGMAPGVRYVDLDASEKPEWTHTVREAVEISATEADVPREVVETCVEDKKINASLKASIRAKLQTEPKPIKDDVIKKGKVR